MADSTGKAQGLAIDNLSFSATAEPTLIAATISAQGAGTNVVLAWVGLPGLTYEVEYRPTLPIPPGFLSTLPSQARARG